MDVRLTPDERFRLKQAQHPRPKVRMFSTTEIAVAAMLWYGEHNKDACCLAENRLMRGENPRAGFI